MDFVYHVLIMCGIYAILCASLNLLVGFGGLFNVGHGAFYGIGAYIGALIAAHVAIPFPLEILASGIGAGLFGIAIGFPSLRLKGEYLALTTYGFAVVMYTIFNNWIAVTRGPMGIPGVPRPKILFVHFNSLPLFLVLVFVSVCISIFILNRVVASPFGKSLMAIREDEIAALAAGKDVAQIKVLVFSLGAFFAGIAGNLFVHYISLADPSSFTTDESFLMFSMVVFGGMGSLRGSILSAIILVLFPEVLQVPGKGRQVRIDRQLIDGLFASVQVYQPHVVAQIDNLAVIMVGSPGIYIYRQTSLAQLAGYLTHVNAHAASILGTDTAYGRTMNAEHSQS